MNIIVSSNRISNRKTNSCKIAYVYLKYNKYALDLLLKEKAHLDV